MISLLADNKTVMITCDLTAASPSIYCFVTLNCSQCDDHQFNTISFKESIQLTTVPGGDYVVTFQAVRADNGEPLDDYLIVTTLQVPKGVPDNAGMLKGALCVIELCDNRNQIIIIIVKYVPYV